DRIARAYKEMEAGAGSRWSLTNESNRAILAERRRAVQRLLAGINWLPLGGLTVIEGGSRTGSGLAALLGLGADASNLTGVDRLPDRVVAARKAYQSIDFVAGNAERLDFDDAEFDLAMAITIFSSILDPAMAANVAKELTRVLKPGGHVLWYDVRFDSLSNPNVKAVTRARIRELFPGLQGLLNTITLAPPIARRLGKAPSVAY